MPPEHRHPRKRDRSRDEDWIRRLLTQGEAAVFSAVLEGRPFAFLRVYVYDPIREAVYTHGGFGGMTGKVMRQSTASEGVPMVLTVFEVGRFLPAEEALEFGVEYASAVVSGTVVEVQDSEEALHALERLMEKYAPHLEAGRDYRPITPNELRRTSVLRMDIESWSGKEKTEPAAFPGAYRLPDVR